MVSVSVRIDDGLDGERLARCDFPEFFQRAAGAVLYHAGIDDNDAVLADYHADVGYVFGHTEPGMPAELDDMRREFVASFFKSKGGGRFVHVGPPWCGCFTILISN